MLIRGRRVLIIGTGTSARELKFIPEDSLVFTCNNGVKLLNDINFKGLIDLYVISSYTLSRHTYIEDNLRGLKIACFAADDLAYVRRKKFPKTTYSYLMYDFCKDNIHLKRMIRPHRIADIRGTSSEGPSSGIRLIEYALYFEAKEIYVIGVDLDKKGHFDGMPNLSDHLDIDNNIMKILGKRYNSIFSLSRMSSITKYIPAQGAL